MRYFFRLTDGTSELNRTKGIDLLGNAAAREEALKFAREIKSPKGCARQELGRLVRADRDRARQGDRHRAVRRVP
jgi:hypothetical protein